MILPQKEAAKFFINGKLNLFGIIRNCARQASGSDVIVANLDGPDADSGTAVEVGIASESMKRPVVICHRTDFRTSIENEVGVNGMFQLADAIIYKPAFANSFGEVATFYKELAFQIDAKIKEVMAKRNSR